MSENEKERLKAEERKKKVIVGLVLAFLAGYEAGTKRMIIKGDVVKQF